MPIKIRRATPEDCEACGALAAELIPRQVTTTPVPVTLATYVADSAGTIVGMVVVIVRSKPRGKPAATVDDIVVHEPWRRTGVGKALLERCRDLAKEMGCHKLTVSCAEAVAPFYESCGFARHELTLRMDLTEAEDVDLTPKS